MRKNGRKIKEKTENFKLFILLDIFSVTCGNIKIIMNLAAQCLSHTSSDSWLLDMKSEMKESAKGKSLQYNFDFESASPNPGLNSRFFWMVSDKKSLSANHSFSEQEDSSEKRKLRLKFYSINLQPEDKE